MEPISFQYFALRRKLPQWFRRAFCTAAPAKHAATITRIHPQYLGRQALAQHHVGQGPNPRLYELLQQLTANQATSKEVADLHSAMLQAFLSAFYGNTAHEEITATTPTTPQESAMPELLALLDAHHCLHQELAAKVAAFNHAWQAMVPGASHTAPMPHQPFEHENE